jgi:hypothetical protein
MVLLVDLVVERVMVPVVQAARHLQVVKAMPVETLEQ